MWAKTSGKLSKNGLMPGTYGNKVKALAVLLNNDYSLPFKKNTRPL